MTDLLAGVRRRLRLAWGVATAQWIAPAVAGLALALVLAGRMRPWAWPEPVAVGLAVVAVAALVVAALVVKDARCWSRPGPPTGDWERATCSPPPSRWKAAGRRDRSGSGCRPGRRTWLRAGGRRRRCRCAWSGGGWAWSRG